MLFNDLYEAHEYQLFIPSKTFLHYPLSTVPSSSKNTFPSLYVWMFTMWILSCHFLALPRRKEKLSERKMLLKLEKRKTKTVIGKATSRLTRRVGYTSNSGKAPSPIRKLLFSFNFVRCRRLAQDLSHPLITTLQQECSRATCPEMKAGEWLYLCVAHGNDGAMEQCCAIDYILHTVDSATALLNSPRTFPSR